MLKQFIPAIRITLVLSILTGLLYPGAVTGLCQLLFRQQANGSLIVKNGHVIGSSLIGQHFARPEYFHPRPSAAGTGYDASASSGSNLGPTSAKLIHGTIKVNDKEKEVVDFDGISLRIVHYCLENGIPYASSVPLDQFKDTDGSLDDVKLIRAFNSDKAPLTFTPKAPVPADAVTGSGSGLDPHISPANASAQAARIARARGVSVDQVNHVIRESTEGPSLRILGDPRVNVLRLNLALDQHFGSASAAELR
jgi:potassium-transporting ATPase KdpC subunit